MATTKRPPPTSELDSGGWTFRARGFAHGPFEPSISGCLTGDLGVPGYEPDGISWLPHPATCPHRAAGPRRRSSVRIGPCRINLSRAASKELPEAREVLETSLESEFPRRVRLERSDLASDEGPQRLGIGRDRDVRAVHAAIKERGDVLVLQDEMKLRPVLQFDQDGLRQVADLGSQGRIGPYLRVEFRDQVLEHLPHGTPPPNSSSLWFRDPASKRRAVSHEARVCGGSDPCWRIHVSKNAIVSVSEA